MIVGPGVHVSAALFAPAPTPASPPAPGQASIPVPAEHVGTVAWLLPVLLGLLLAAIACYKHRGLPGGH